jgi:hypothetical protein
MSLRARVEQLPRYAAHPDAVRGPAEWVKLADVLALLPTETAETRHYADGGPCPKCGREMGHASGLGQCGVCQMLDYGYFTPKCPHGHDLTRVICPHGCLTHK